jgi:hypothetical protein
MGNSTTTLQNVYDWAKGKGIPVPTDQPGGYGTRLAVEIGNNVMSAIVAERFNPKWNRAIAAPFLTNSWQQDYPQIGLVNIGWGEDVDVVDINNTAFPKPLNVPVTMTWRRQLSRTSLAWWPPNQICWMYNQDLSYGTWPGPGVTFNPQLTPGPVIQNPLMSMQDANGNLLIVTTLGTTVAGPAPAAVTPTYGQVQFPGGLAGPVILYILGSTPPAWLVTAKYLNIVVSDPNLQPAGPVASLGVSTGYLIGGQTYYAVSYVLPNAPTTAQEPVTSTVQLYVGPPLLPASSPEGTTFQDGTVVWTVVGPMSQGFRVSPLPGATGPVYQITPYYQMLLSKLTSLQSLINPIPDDQRYIFQEGVEVMCRKGSANPSERAEAMKAWPLWLAAVEKILKQNNREVDAYGAYPADSVVESVYGPWRGLRNPQDPSQPY